MIYFYFGLTIYFAIIFIHGAYCVARDIQKDETNRLLLLREEQFKRWQKENIKHIKVSKRISRMILYHHDESYIRDHIVYELILSLAYSLQPHVTIKEEDEYSDITKTYSCGIHVCTKP